jgi:hypothetical protein
MLFAAAPDKKHQAIKQNKSKQPQSDSEPIIATNTTQLSISTI